MYANSCTVQISNKCFTHVRCTCLMHSKYEEAREERAQILKCLCFKAYHVYKACPHLAGYCNKSPSEPVLTHDGATVTPSTSLVPRPLPKQGRRPGIHCLRMRETTPGFYGGSYNSVPYRRLYLWTVRERPFYRLGVAFTGKAAGCESVYTLFHRRRLRSDNSLMRVALFCV